MWRYLPERPEHVVGLDAIIKRHLNEEPDDYYRVMLTAVLLPLSFFFDHLLLL